jgi:transposase-like protein
MGRSKSHKFLSETEVKRYDALATKNSVKAAALSLGLAPQTLYNWMTNVKKRYRLRRGWINSTLAQTRRGGCLKNLLTERNKMAPPDSEDLEEWEEE